MPTQQSIVFVVNSVQEILTIKFFIFHFQITIIIDELIKIQDLGSVALILLHLIQHVASSATTATSG